MIFQEVQLRTNSQIHKWSHKHRSSRKVTSKHVCVHIVYLKSDDIDMNHEVLKFPPHYSKPKEKKPKRIQNERDKIVTKTVVQERNQVELLELLFSAFDAKNAGRWTENRQADQFHEADSWKYLQAGIFNKFQLTSWCSE